jgi:branched-chain amino acid transport system permease protein
LVAALAAAADGLILKRLAYDPEATIVATIGLLYMIQQATLSLYGPNANPVAAPFRVAHPAAVVRLFRLQAFRHPCRRGGASGALDLFMTRTRAGLIMRATQVDRTTARAFGINVDRVYMGTFALGAGLAALAGVLVVPIQQAHYLMGGDPLLLSFIVVIIGGLGKPARHPDRGTGHRPVRRGDLDVLHADSGEDPCHASCRHGACLPPAGPVRSQGVTGWA